ncbi:energy-coupling factor transporter transmembrane component T family protein [Hydrogenophaga sp.]|uniref:energy-coupling factor transporter transmembrane component T family protein n=1 Tax=Hydrogenophaga sp. TaxID=1904254 RepID=UPI00391CB63A
MAPSAKALWASAGLVSAWVSATPAIALAVAGVLALATCLGAGVPGRTIMTVALPPLGFVLLTCTAMLVTPCAGSLIGWCWTPEAWPQAATVAGRALASLAATLGLVLTTPMPDLLALGRRLRVPAVLLDLMVLGYRMLFVFTQAWEEAVTAQSARLGYLGRGAARRSIAVLLAHMAAQVWWRARGLQVAAQARAWQGELRVLPAHFAQARRELVMAALAGALLVLATASAGRGWPW